MWYYFQIDRMRETDIVICNNCGADIPMYNGFCPNCGARFLENFDSSVFKARAKAVLKKWYWPAFAVSLIEMVLVRGLDITDRINGYTADTSSVYYYPSIISTLLAMFGIVWILSVVYSIFIANPILVGSSKYFIKSHDDCGKIPDIFYAFKNGQYLKIVGSLAWQNLFALLWMLLFIIPGIIKSYAYCLVPYILAENPDIGYKRALKLSMQMTNGYKGEIFLLQLSFIGWFLLGLLCLGIGILFVQPYYNATFAEMYLSLKNNAIKVGICMEADFIRNNTNGPQI